MTMSPPPRNVMARAGRILGVLSLVLAIILIVIGLWLVFGQAPEVLLLIGIILEWVPGLVAIVGIVISAGGIREARSFGERPIATRGLVLSISALAAPMVAIVVVGAVSGNWNEMWGQPV